MTDRNDSVIGLAFELQRNQIELGQRAIEQTIETRRAFDDRIRGGLETQEEAQETVLEFTRDSINELLDTVADTAGEDQAVADIREAVNDGFDTLLDQQAEVFDAVGERYDPEADDVRPLGEELLTALDEQLDVLVEANESIEDATVEAFEEIFDQLEELVDVLGEQSESVSEEFASQLERFGDELEDQLDRFEEQFDSRMDRMEAVQDRFDDLRDEVEVEVTGPDEETEESADEADA